MYIIFRFFFTRSYLKSEGEEGEGEEKENSEGRVIKIQFLFSSVII